MDWTSCIKKLLIIFMRMVFSNLIQWKAVLIFKRKIYNSRLKHVANFPVFYGTYCKFSCFLRNISQIFLFSTEHVANFPVFYGRFPNILRIGIFGGNLLNSHHHNLMSQTYKSKLWILLNNNLVTKI